MKTIPLTTAEGGIDRRRVKGGAQANTLYDLLNAYVEDDGTIVARPPVAHQINLPASCKGLCAHNGKLYSFTSSPADLSSGSATYVIELLVDPVVPASAISVIHFAAQYLGYLYVVAEFASGNVYHYWLQPGVTWGAATAYNVGDIVFPTVPNGFAYRANRLADSNPLWVAGTPRAVGDKVEPTTANGYFYEVVSVAGDNPRSGDTEPTWIAADGAIVIESADLPPASATPVTGSTVPGDDNDNGTQPAPEPIRDRYRQPIGEFIER